MDGIYRTRENGDSERTGLSSQGLREESRDLRIGRGLPEGDRVSRRERLREGWHLRDRHGDSER